MTCLSCGGETKPWLSTPIDCEKNTPTPYGHVVRCVDCGMGSLSPVPPASEIASFYDLPDYYTHDNSGPGEAPKYSFAERLLMKLSGMADKGVMFDPADMVKLLPAGGSIIDLGCGGGAYLHEFMKLGFSCIGVDPDVKARANAASMGVNVIDGTADNVPAELDGRTFDLVIMTHALEHSLDPKKAVENALRLTKRGGLCYIEVPNCDAEHFRMFTICSRMFDAPRHIHFFTPRALRMLAKRVGYLWVSTSFVYYQRAFVPVWREWEQGFARDILAADPSAKVVGHTFLRSVALFLSSFWRAPERKYDSFGLLLTKG